MRARAEKERGAEGEGWGSRCEPDLGFVVLLASQPLHEGEGRAQGETREREERRGEGGSRGDEERRGGGRLV